MTTQSGIRELSPTELEPTGSLYDQADNLAGMALTAAGYKEDQAAKLSKELLTTQPKNGTRHFIGAIAGEELIGLAIVAREGSGDKGKDDSAAIHALAVNPKHRREWTGVGLVHAARQVGHGGTRTQNTLHATLPVENISLRLLFSSMNVIVETEPQALTA